MEISQCTIGVFYLSRILGLAPYKIQRDKKGRVEVERSIIWTIYSGAFVLTLASLTYNGLLFDANSKIPIRPSFRMKSATSKVVTAVDVSVVVLATVAGFLCSIVGFHQTQELNKRLNEADDTLSLYTDEVKDKKRSYVLMIGVMFGITFMLGLDVWCWFRMANNMTVEGQESPQLNVQWYIPFYGLYYILMGLHIHFAQSAVGLGRRYRRLNLALKNSFQEDIKSNAAYGIGPGIVLVSTAMNRNTGKTTDTSTMSSTGLVPSLMTGGSNLKKISFNDKIINNGGGTGPGIGRRPVVISKQHILERLASTHESLGKAMGTISGAYGIAVLVMLVSCLLHLVATSYFLFLEMLVDDNSRVSWLQLLWILFHIMRLLLIVEPCHVTFAEAKRTVMIVCEIQRNSKDESISNRMEKFWQQLMADSSNFSAVGMCTINRQILTSFSGAIATYLVILIQFQKTDG